MSDDLRTIEVIVDEYTELRTRAGEALTWRALGKEAIEQLAEQHHEIERQRRQIAALREEIRALVGRADDEAAA